MNIWSIRINLAVLEDIDLIVGEQNSVAVFDRREIYSQRAWYGERLVPGLDLLVAVFVVFSCLLREGRGLVPGLGVFLPHRLNEIFGGFDLGGSRGRRN